MGKSDAVRPSKKLPIHFKKINSFHVGPYLDLVLNSLESLKEQKVSFFALKNHKMITE